MKLMKIKGHLNPKRLKKKKAETEKERDRVGHMQGMGSSTSFTINCRIKTFFECCKTGVANAFFARQDFKNGSAKFFPIFS